MKFKVGDKVVLKEKELKKFGIENTKIREGVVVALSDVATLIYVKRGSRREPWHIDYWRKMNERSFHTEV